MHSSQNRRTGLGFPLRIKIMFMVLVLFILQPPYTLSGENQNGASNATVPDFPITTLSGESFRMDTLSHRGTVVLLNFWGLRCDACIQELPYLNDISRKYRDRVAVFGVNVDGVDGSTLKEFMGELEIRIDYAVVPDPEFALVDRFKMNAAPLTIIIGPGRIVRYRHEGYEPGQEKQLEMMLNTTLEMAKTGER